MLCNGRALQNVQMYKLNMVLDVHPYAITAPSKTGGRWQTYVKEGDKRKIIRASSKEKLMDKLYTVYFDSKWCFRYDHGQALSRMVSL